MLLAAQTLSPITAIDTDEAALARLRQKVFDSDHSARIQARCLDMRSLPAPDQPCDLIWAEGSACIMGVEQALKAWRPLLRPGGALVLSDMMWRTDSPSASVRAFWASEYPAMATASIRLEQAKLAGYRLLGHFDMEKAAMNTDYCPLAARVDAVSERMAGQRVLDDLRAELHTWREGSGQFSFEVFVLQRP